MAISAVDDWLSQGCARSSGADRPEQRVEQARAVVEHERPQHAGRRHRQHHRREVEAAQQRKAAPLRIEQHRHRQPQRHLEHQRAEDVEHDVHVAHQVRGVGEGPLEIGKAGPARRGEPVPMGEGVVERRAERQQHEAAEQQQGRSDEQQVHRAGGDRRQSGLPRRDRPCQAWAYCLPMAASVSSSQASASAGYFSPAAT